ncbi:hypothetical protein GALL_178040 [mine drainage metagenome]|uniref:Uncharacterized protein n=1 Tax=mine drainage metagenome TaxID=410659 RepID=A0A1J5SJ66_9ZZZZ
MKVALLLQIQIINHRHRWLHKVRKLFLLQAN